MIGVFGEGRVEHVKRKATGGEFRDCRGQISGMDINAPQTRLCRKARRMRGVDFHAIDCGGGAYAKEKRRPRS